MIVECEGRIVDCGSEVWEAMKSPCGDPDVFHFRCSEFGRAVDIPVTRSFFLHEFNQGSILGTADENGADAAAHLFFMVRREGRRRLSAGVGGGR